jgi:hypothetical protein
MKDMKPTFGLPPKAWLAVGLVAGLLILWGFHSGEILLPLTVFCTAGIAAFDSAHVKLWRFKTGLSYGPVGLFAVCALFWPFAIIWYFVVRVRIARGTMPLRDGFKHGHAI